MRSCGIRSGAREALLKRYGVTVEEGKEKPADPLLLMEMIELREGIADARRAGDAASVERQSNGLKAREKSAIEALGAAFRELEAATATGATVLSPEASAAADSVVKQIGILRFTGGCSTKRHSPVRSSGPR